MTVIDGKVALVTGGSAGIGRMAALAFAQRGIKVAIASRNPVEGEETLQLLKETGSEAIFIQTDVTQASEVQNLIDSIAAAYGRLDYAFNNAGIEGKVGKITDLTEEDWDQVINTNLKGIWLSMKYQIPQMLLSGGGVIVNTSSVWGLSGSQLFSPYCASKHGVIGLTKALALEWAKQGIRINAVCPAGTDTGMQRRLAKNFEMSYDKWQEEMQEKHPIGRFSDPEEVARVVLWLCLDAPSSMTGSAVLIDGGWTAQ